MTTFVEYTIITKADVKSADSQGYWSTQDGYQQQTSYNNGGTDTTAVVKRLDLLVKPTPFNTPLSSRIMDINLEDMDTDYIRILHIKADKQFLFSSAGDLAELNTNPRELQRTVFKDYGPKPISPSPFTPDTPFPKYIRIINPLEINGGGSGNDVADIPIFVQVHLITNKFNT